MAAYTPSSDGAVLELLHVSKRLGAATLSYDLDLRLGRGEAAAVVGRSGIGKTTLLRIAALLDTEYRGAVTVLGQRFTGGARLPSKASQLRLRSMGYVPQFHGLLSTLTVEENIRLPLDMMGVPRRQATERVHVVAERLGVTHVLTSFPAEVSGGESQRAAIARALVKSPGIIVAEEPYASQDERNIRLITDAFREYTRSGGSILMSAVRPPNTEWIREVPIEQYLSTSRAADTD